MAQVPAANMEGERFMVCTAASLQGAIFIYNQWCPDIFPEIRSVAENKTSPVNVNRKVLLILKSPPAVSFMDSDERINLPNIEK